MAMRSAIYDEWLEQEVKRNPNAIVLHIGCGMDSRIERVSKQNTKWYDIDFPDVIEVYGYDNPEELANKSGLMFVK